MAGEAAALLLRDPEKYKAKIRDYIDRCASTPLVWLRLAVSRPSSGCVWLVVSSRLVSRRYAHRIVSWPRLRRRRVEREVDRRLLATLIQSTMAPEAMDEIKVPPAQNLKPNLTRCP